MNGGELTARVLRNHGVEHLFTLCGGHISPILVSAKREGIRVIDVRDEAAAVFAADAMARLTGIPGVAAVTAGPGLTNTVTAVKNAQLAQSPLILIGGATATFLKGRGSLQDIDQMALMKPHVKRAMRIAKLRDLVPQLELAFAVARTDVPGPVFIELPVDLLYDETLVRDWYRQASGEGKAKGLSARALQWYLRRHVNDLFVDGNLIAPGRPHPTPRREAPAEQIDQAAVYLRRTQRPVLLVGSQAMLCACEMYDMVGAVEKLGVPVYLAGAARGLLGRDHPLQYFHRRREALREADLVVLAGVPQDFRLDYGRQINRKALIVSVNLSARDLRLNRRPTMGVLADPGVFLIELAQRMKSSADRFPEWSMRLRERDNEREAEIRAVAAQSTEFINPLALLKQLNEVIDDNSVLVVDGGDFVASAAYTLRPRGPFSWLDPGAFGTLGVGAGFAMAAKLARPQSEVWLLYGDGSLGYGLAEFDTFVRHDLPVIALVGNDGSWAQIAREQVEILHDDVGTVLARTAYHRVAEGFGAMGLLLEKPEDVSAVLQQAKQLARGGTPVLINAMIGATEFRKGAVSM